MQAFTSGYQPDLKCNFLITGLVHFFKQPVDKRSVIFFSRNQSIAFGKLMPGLAFTLADLLVTRNNIYSF